MDFGIATRLDDAGSDGSAKGLTGTPAYMSPEYIEKQLVSPALDVYAAGLVLYEMVTGKRAVSGESMAQIAYQILNTQITLPADVSIDPTLSSIIGQACAKDPALRTPSIAAMKKRLDEYLGAAATPTGEEVERLCGGIRRKRSEVAGK